MSLQSLELGHDAHALQAAYLSYMYTCGDGSEVVLQLLSSVRLPNVRANDIGWLFGS